jgi:Na+-driven multidrug efflux pump
MKMGIFGAILATGLAPVISILVMTPYLLSGRQEFRLDLSWPDGADILSVHRLGFPSFVVEISSGIVIVLYNYIILGLKGDVGVAAYGVIANISVVAIAIFTGIAQGMQPICSKAFGRGHHSSAARIKDYAVGIAFAVAAVLYGVIFVFAKEIATMFNSQDDPYLQVIAVEGLRLYFIGILFAGVNIVLSNYFVSLEWAWPAHIITLARGIVFLAPLAVGLSSLWGIRGTWLAFPVCEVLVMILSVGLLILHKTRLCPDDKRSV